jgi:hypothetical protein
MACTQPTRGQCREQLAEETWFFDSRNFPYAIPKGYFTLETRHAGENHVFMVIIPSNSIDISQ